MANVNAFATLLSAMNMPFSAETGARGHAAHDGSPIARSVALQVLNATDAEDLQFLLDEIVVAESTWKAERQLSREQRARLKVPPRDGELAAIRASLTPTLGEVAAARYTSGFAAMHSVILSVDAVVTLMSRATGVAPSAPTSSVRPSDIIYDVSLPVGLRESAAGALRSLAAAHVINFAREEGIRLAPWLALALAGIFAEGFTSIRAWFREHDGASIIGELSKGMAEAGSFRELFDDWTKEAEAEGEPVYFPFGDPEAASA